MKTAEEFYRQITGCVINHGDIKTAMIEFAKMHVQAALQEASEKAEFDVDIEGNFTNIDSTSILNSYPDSNIK